MLSYRRILALLLLNILPVMLSGCEGVLTALNYGVGKAYLSRNRANIYIAKSEKEVADCEYVQQVRSSTSWGGLFLQDEALERVISDVCHDASVVGANTLVIRNRSKGFWGSSVMGEAYKCDRSRSSN